MIKEYEIKGGDASIIYYDEETKCIARVPSNSNLKEHGPDNSFYFGLNKKEKTIAVEVLKKIFDVDDLKKMVKKIFKMQAPFGIVTISFNISSQGQIQLHFDDLKIQDFFNRLWITDPDIKELSSDECKAKYVIFDFSRLQIRTKPKAIFENLL